MIFCIAVFNINGTVTEKRPSDMVSFHSEDRFFFLRLCLPESSLFQL